MGKFVCTALWHHERSLKSRVCAVTLTFVLARVQKRIAICFTPAHWENIHGVCVNYDLWDGLLQT